MTKLQIAEKAWAAITENRIPALTDKDCIAIIVAAIEEALRSKLAYNMGWNDCLESRHAQASEGEGTPEQLAKWNVLTRKPAQASELEETSNEGNPQEYGDSN